MLRYFTTQSKGWLPNLKQSKTTVTRNGERNIWRETHIWTETNRAHVGGVEPIASHVSASRFVYITFDHRTNAALFRLMNQPTRYAQYVRSIHVYQYKYMYEMQSQRRKGKTSVLRASRPFSWLEAKPFRLLLPPPRRPASTAPGEGLHGGLLESSCDRRRRRGMQNRLNVGMYTPASEYETLIRRLCAKQTSIVHTITDKSMICAVVSMIHWFFAERP